MVNVVVGIILVFLQWAASVDGLYRPAHFFALIGLTLMNN